MPFLLSPIPAWGESPQPAAAGSRTKPGFTACCPGQDRPCERLLGSPQNFYFKGLLHVKRVGCMLVSLALFVSFRLLTVASWIPFVIVILGAVEGQCTATVYRHKFTCKELTLTATYSSCEIVVCSGRCVPCSSSSFVSGRLGTARRIAAFLNLRTTLKVRALPMGVATNLHPRIQPTAETKSNTACRTVSPVVCAVIYRPPKRHKKRLFGRLRGLFNGSDA